MDPYIIIGFILGCIIGLIIYTLRYRIKQNDKVLERIDVVEKDIESDARFFISVVYKSGRVELITPKALTEEEVVEKSVEFIEKNNS